MGKKILTVDDSAILRQMVNFALMKEGYEMIEAVDGKDALEKLKKEKENVHMIIADLNMPRMDGISLIRELRAIPMYKFIPIIMLTTESQVKKRQEGKSVGATGWIVKPFRPEQLIAIIKKVLG